jgi:hypothetical protein
MHPVQQHLPQQEIQKTGLSGQALSSTNSNTLKVTIVMQHVTLVVILKGLGTETN